MSDDGDAASLELRRARLGEALAVAELWLVSRRASVQIPPAAHSDEEVRAWFGRVVFSSQEVWVIERAGDLVALMVLDGEWIEQLYVHPDWTGRGLGSRLVRLAKQARASLDLWTFESNLGARRFYERHGFTVASSTDGANEEGVSDVRYHWEPS